MTSVSLRSGEKIECGAVMPNCAGINAWRMARIGLDLPVRPRKRLVYVIDCREELTDAPLTIDRRFRLNSGVLPEESNDPDSTDFELDYSLFEELIWPTLANRVPAFEAIKLILWPHYDYNVLDQNVIIGPAPHGADDGERVLRPRSCSNRRRLARCHVRSYRTLDLRHGYDRATYPRGQWSFE